MAGKLSGARIAIVEDDTLLLDSLALYLRTRECRVETFACAEDAGEAATPGKYEVVISDYVLPGEDGLSFLRRVHEQAANAGTVLITGHTRMTLPLEAKAAGIDGFLTKPLYAGDLEAALRRILEYGGEPMDQETKEVQVKTEKLETQLKEWGIDLEKLKLKASRTKADAKSEIHREIASLRTRLTEAQGKLEELKTAGDAASTELKKGVENAWAEMKKAVENATAKFR